MHCRHRKRCGPQDYNRYRLSGREAVLTVIQFLLLLGALSYLFYQSVYACIPGVLFYPVFYRKKKREYIRRQKAELKVQFKDALQSAAGALRAGYSIENAWKEAQKDMAQQYGKDSSIYKELLQINHKSDCNEPMEQLLDKLADRSRIEDIEDFSVIFRFAKRSGGDFVVLIYDCVQRIADRIELQAEIETTLSAKKAEQRLMNIMPLFILAFVNQTSLGFLSVLYHNRMGIAVMTGALLVYILAYLWAEKIVDIEV